VYCFFPKWEQKPQPLHQIDAHGFIFKPAAKVYSIALLQSWINQRRCKYPPTEKRASYEMTMGHL
jgi:hypothetical protein